MTHAAALAMLLASLGRGAAAQPAQREWLRVSPFTDVQVLDGDVARVVYDGSTFELVSVDGLTTEKMLAFCRKTYGERWEDRFATDLADVMIDMGSQPAETVKLVLRDARTRQEKTVERAAMTPENRRQVRQAMRARLQAADLGAGEKIEGPARMRGVLKSFRDALENRWSYLPLSKLDLPRAVDALEKRIDAGGLTYDEFVLELRKIIGQGIDGHAGVSGREDSAAKGFTPFLVEPIGERFVAFKADRSGLLSQGHPFVTEIDSKPLAAWQTAAEQFIADGSPQYVRGHFVRMLRSIQFLRKQLGGEPRDAITVTLVSADGAERQTFELPVAASVPTYGTWPPENHRPRVPEGVAYLRLARMERDSDVAASIAGAQRSRGLIIDVRDNAGGSRDALLKLAGCLTKPGSPPRVVNAAVYRLHPDHTAELMATRFLYPADWRGWTPAEREAIATFRKTFRPQWAPPAGKYSDWHYMVLSAAEQVGPHFDKPVAVLMNGNCFSATDVFLSALKGTPNVTLVGTPSGGGSANARGVRLEGSSLNVRLGTMVSFQSSGKLFDTHGVEPDVHVEPDPSFFVGGPDRQLERAVEHLTRAAKSGS